MRLFWLIFCGAMMLAVALIALAPASLIDARLRAASAEGLCLDDAEGTIWRGHARLIGVLPEGRLVLIDRLAWQVEMLSLLRGAIAFRLFTADHAPAGRVAVSTQAVEANAVRFHLPAAVLGLAPALTASQPRGELMIYVPELDWREASSSGQGHIIWEHARLTSPDGSPRELGRVVFDARAESNRLTLRSAQGSPIAIELTLDRQTQGAIEWHARLNP